MMENLLPDPVTVENPFRPYCVAVKICILGVIGFSVCSIFLHQAGIHSRLPPLVHIKGYPLTTATLVDCAQLVFLLIMSCILSGLRRRSAKRLILHAEAYSAKLRQELRKMKKREKELEKGIADLERFNAMTMGREQRILELKHEVNTLRQTQGMPLRYQTAPAD